jgi:hypothetical protein
VVHGGVLGRAEAAINRFRETGILQSKVFAHDDGMHDRKDAGTLVVIAFHRPVVRKKTRYLRRVLEDAFRHIGRKSRHRFRHFQHLTQVLIGRGVLYFDVGRMG